MEIKKTGKERREIERRGTKVKDKEVEKGEEEMETKEEEGEEGFGCHRLIKNVIDVRIVVETDFM